MLSASGPSREPSLVKLIKKEISRRTVSSGRRTPDVGGGGRSRRPRARIPGCSSPSGSEQRPAGSSKSALRSISRLVPLRVHGVLLASLRASCLLLVSITARNGHSRNGSHPPISEGGSVDRNTEKSGKGGRES